MRDIFPWKNIVGNYWQILIVLIVISLCKKIIEWFLVADIRLGKSFYTTGW